jgi:hypothetical protein
METGYIKLRRKNIECKWQQVSGSVDEKLPYLYLNCIEAMPEKNNYYRRGRMEEGSR